MSALYRVYNIRHTYGPRTVLTVEHLLIEAGSKLALIGPSGAGKSTLLRLLCLLEAPTRGSIEYAGQCYPGRVPLPIQREMTLVFQRPLLLDRTVEHNVEYGLHLRCQRRQRRVAEAITLLGLDQLAAARAHTLSGGEVQRVALARALVLQPRVLLLDEPTANLDPQNVALIEGAINRLHHETGCTVVIATHNVQQARRLTQHTAVLLNGMLVEIGATAALLAPTGTQALDRRARDFINGE